MATKRKDLNSSRAMQMYTSSIMMELRSSTRSFSQELILTQSSLTKLLRTGIVDPSVLSRLNPSSNDPHTVGALLVHRLLMLRLTLSDKLDSSLHTLSDIVSRLSKTERCDRSAPSSGSSGPKPSTSSTKSCSPPCDLRENNASTCPPQRTRRCKSNSTQRRKRLTKKWSKNSPPRFAVTKSLPPTKVSSYLSSSRSAQGSAMTATEAAITSAASTDSRRSSN